jgi:hypothetical protein
MPHPFLRASRCLISFNLLMLPLNALTALRSVPEAGPNMRRPNTAYCTGYSSYDGDRNHPYQFDGIRPRPCGRDRQTGSKAGQPIEQ